MVDARPLSGRHGGPLSGALGGKAVYSLGSIASLLDSGLIIPWEVARVLIGIGLGLFVGGGLGLAQLLALRRKLARAGWWILATIAGTLLAELFVVPLYFGSWLLFLWHSVARSAYLCYNSGPGGMRINGWLCRKTRWMNCTGPK